MSEQSTFTPLPEGTKVRITRTINDGNFRVYAGTEFVIEDYISAEQGPGVAYYDGSTPGNYGDIAVPTDAVELVMTAEAMTARPLLRGYDDEGFTVEDADYSGALPHLTPERQQVTSAEGLAALPIGSVVLDRYGDAGLIDGIGPEGSVLFAETAPVTLSYAAKHFAPFTVLYAPETDR